VLEKMPKGIRIDTVYVKKPDNRPTLTLFVSEFDITVNDHSVTT